MWSCAALLIQGVMYCVFRRAPLYTLAATSDILVTVTSLSAQSNLAILLWPQHQHWIFYSFWTILCKSYCGCAGKSAVDQQVNQQFLKILKNQPTDQITMLHLKSLTSPFFPIWFEQHISSGNGEKL